MGLKGPDMKPRINPLSELLFVTKLCPLDPFDTSSEGSCGAFKNDLLVAQCGLQRRATSNGRVTLLQPLHGFKKAVRLYYEQTYNENAQFSVCVRQM